MNKIKLVDDQLGKILPSVYLLIMSYITLICLNNAYTSGRSNIDLNVNAMLLCNFITECIDIVKC